MSDQHRNHNGSRRDELSSRDDELLTNWLVQIDETLAVGEAPTIRNDVPATADVLPELRGLECVLSALHQAAQDGELEYLRPAAAVDTSAADQFAENRNDIAAGERIGRFELICELGRGGYGVVFLAHDPSLNRDVALKLPRPEVLVTPDLRRRFVREAQAAARLEHPNLVGVHEIGEDGAVCFLVSQYCHGPSLAEWLRQQNRSVPVRDAATLVAALAEALAHAHREGVLHRDIKPTNVLLDPDATSRHGTVPREGRSLAEFTPKLNDFGLAKLAESAEHETGSGAVLGTPTYMSPEQAQGQTREIGPGADIYSLGVLLYELLTQRPPFVGQNDAETLKQVAFDEPVPPTRLRPGMSRDLEAICLKCLEKRPAQRYATAHALAEDLQRFLDGQPTIARPLRPWRRLWRWSTRNPGVAGLAATVGFLLAALAVGSAIAAVGMARLAERERDSAQRALSAKQLAEQAQQVAEMERDEKENQRARAREAERQAQAELESRRQVSRFLIDLLETPDSSGLSGFGLRRQSDANHELTARQMLDRGEARLAHELKDQPLVRAQLLNTIGNVYSNMGDISKASALLDEALALQRAHHAPPLELADTLHNATWVRRWQGRVDEAERFGREALAIRRELLGDDNLLVAASMFNLGWALADRHREKIDDAEKLFMTALEIRRRHLPWNHRDVGISLSALAAVHMQTKDSQGAMPWLVQAAFVFVQQPGGDKLGKALSAYQGAVLMRNRRQYDRAEEKYRETIQLLKDFFGADHPATALALGDLAGLLKETRQFDKAEVAIREAIAMARHFAPNGHPKMIAALDELGEALHRRGDFAEAIELYQEALQISTTLYGKNAIETIGPLAMLAHGYWHQADYARAIAVMREVVTLAYMTSGVGTAYRNARVDLAGILADQGNDVRAEYILRNTHRAYGPKDFSGPNSKAMLCLAELLNRRDPGSAEAEQFIQPFIAQADAAGARQDVDTAHNLVIWSRILLGQGRVEEATSAAREALRIHRERVPSSDFRIDNGEMLLGACLTAQGNYSEAVTHMAEGYRGLQKTRGPRHPRTVEAREQLQSAIDEAPDGTDVSALQELLAQVPST